jgi:hypothetical protein
VPTRWRPRGWPRACRCAATPVRCALPPPDVTRSVSKGATSRCLVALSERQLLQWLSRPLSELDLPAVMPDGIHFRDRVILVVAGIDAQCNKHVLGLREASTESTRVVRLLVERGLIPTDPGGGSSMAKRRCAAPSSSAFV